MNEAPEARPSGTPGRLPPPDPRLIRPRTPEAREPLHWRNNLLLLLATLATTLVVGANYVAVPAWAVFVDPLLFLRAGAPFAFTLLGILGAHEMGHYLAARRHGVDVSLPFFIPIPIGFGTFGAVIRMRTPVPTRAALFDIGVAGPLAGFVAALPFLVLGVLSSEPIALTTLTTDYSGAYYGEPLVHKLLVWLLRNDPPQTTLDMSPYAMAGWVALLVTFINLIPVGQLDGGHIRHALLGNRADKFQKPLAVFMIAWGGLGIATQLVWGMLGTTGPLVRFLLSWCSPAFFIWGLLLLVVFGRAGWAHPPVGEWTPLSPARRLVAGLTVAVFILVFMPAPISTEIY